MITKEELTKMLVDYHAEPYRNRESAAQELAEKIWCEIRFQYILGRESVSCEAINNPDL